MKYKMINLKNLKRYSISLLLLNYNNTYCGCLCDKKNKKNTNDSNSGNNDNNDNKTTNQEEIEKRNKDVIDYLLKLFNDKKAKLTKLDRENELKITEQQIKDIKDQSQVNNIIEELNKLKIHNNPATSVVLDPDNIPNEPYIFKCSSFGDTDKFLNFYKYINEDININVYTSGNIQKVVYNKLNELINNKKLFHFLKNDLLFFDAEKNQEYIENNGYYLYIDKNTFNLKDGIKLGDFKLEDFKISLSVNHKKFENCYLLFNDGSTLTVFKKKTIIDLEHLENYKNIFYYIQVDGPETKEEKENRLMKQYENLTNKKPTNYDEVEKFITDIKNINIYDYTTKENKKLYLFITNAEIEEIEFKGYKKSTEKPKDYATIDVKKKFSTNINNSDGNWVNYYFVKEK